MCRFLIFLFLATCTLVDAAPGRRQNDQVSLQQLKFSVGNIRNEIENHESEILMLGQRLNNQETTMELLREEIHARREDPGMQLLESKVGGLVGDIQKIRLHANDLSDVVDKSHKKIESLEKTVARQEKNIANMQTALKSLLEALDVKDPSTTDTYKVKSGDSLEKIAKKHSTSIKKLKELNDLKGDRIRIGQKLKIPTA